MRKYLKPEDFGNLNYYLKKYRARVNPNRIIITFGSSGAFILAFLSAFDKGDTVGVTVPNYPAYKNMIKAFDLKMKPIFCNSKNIENQTVIKSNAENT